MKQTETMPLLVYWGLYGVNSRSVALGFMWLSVALALATVTYGFFDPLGFSGAVLFVAAGWYWYAIKWVDKHSSWDKA